MNPSRPNSDDDIPFVDDLRLAAPRRPGPSFLMAVVWCVAFLVVLYGPVLLVMVVGMFTEAGKRPDQNAALREYEAAANAGGVHPDIAPWAANAFLAGEVVSVTFCVLILRAVVGREWPRKVAFAAPRPEHVVLALVVLPALMVLHGLAHEFGRWVVPDRWDLDLSSSGKMLKETFAGVPRIVAVLAVGVGPGLAEEMWCRGFLGRGLIARKGYVGGVVLTSMLFGLLHIGPSYAVGTAVMGGLLHFVYLTTRSLWVPILLHFLNNTLGVLDALGDISLAGLEPPEEGPRPYLLYAAAVGLTAAVFAVLYRTRGRLDGWSPPFPTVALPPADSGGRVVHEKLSVADAVLVFVAAGLFAAAWMFG